MNDILAGVEFISGCPYGPCQGCLEILIEASYYCPEMGGESHGSATLFPAEIFMSLGGRA